MISNYYLKPQIEQPLDCKNYSCMLNSSMSAEHLNENFEHEFEAQKKQNPKVDINILMDKVREEKKREKKENLIFISLIASVVLVTGAIASF